jgi:Fe-Mn family superoxide dismutase
MLGATGVAVVAATPPRFAFALAAAPAPSGPFKVDPLPYPFGALEPFIDAQTMEFHHDRHHQGAITILNNIARENPQIADKPIVEVLGNLDAVPEAIRTGVRNNMGAHANHTMFLQIILNP